MLKAAAERGVSVKIVVYKEVQAALTCKSPVPTPAERVPVAHANSVDSELCCK